MFPRTENTPTMRRCAVLLLALMASSPLACKPSTETTTVPDSATTTIISLQGIDCEDCGTDVIQALGKQGIYATSFDRVAAELTVQYDAAQISVADMLAAVSKLGYVGIEGAGHGAYIPKVEFDPGFDVLEIAKAGEVVELEPHLAAGKVTVFDFYAIWCEPCREVDKHMVDVLGKHDDVALRKIDIIDWDSEAAKHHMKTATSLPYVIVYGRDGKKVTEISGLALDELDAAIEKGRSR